MVHKFPITESHPAHAENEDPLDGVAVRVNVVGLVTTVVQELPQSIPAGDEETLPVPFPSRATRSTGDVPAETA